MRVRGCFFARQVLKLVGMYAGLLQHPQLADLARRQVGVVSRQQLAASGMTWASVQAQIDAQRWTAWARNAVLLHNARPDRTQLMWIALLDAGFPSALSSHSVLEVCGFTSFAKEAALVHLIVPRGARVAKLPGVEVHESRRFEASHVVEYNGLPCTDTSRSAVDAAAWQRSPRFACAILAAVVQQRICTVDQLDRAMACAGRVRHKRHLRLALADIGGGAESLGEIDVAALCRRYGLVEPTRQRFRLDAKGRRRYLDCEWQLGDGFIVVLEIDGAHHLSVESWQADMQRERDLVISGRRVLRATTTEVRLEPAAIAADLRSMGIPNRLVRT